MPKNRGKAFEKLIRETLDNTVGVRCERLHDGMSGYAVTSKNPSDLMVFKKPYLYYVECKSIHGASIPIKNLSQVEDIAERCTTDGVKGKFIIWYVDHAKTFWIDYTVIQGFIKLGYKSINYNALSNCAGCVEIPAVYKRVYGKYDFSTILE